VSIELQPFGKTHKVLVWTENQLLVKLRQVEQVFRLSALLIYPCQELAHNFDSLGEIFLVPVVFGRVFDNHFEEKGISGQTRCRFGQVSVQLELSR
jgi:hypothetical protein